MMCDKTNNELKKEYEKATTHCLHGYGGFCGTCMYAREPIDIDLQDEYTVYCKLSKKKHSTL